DAKEDANKHQEQVERRQNDDESLQKRGDFFQRTISSPTSDQGLEALLASLRQSVTAAKLVYHIPATASCAIPEFPLPGLRPFMAGAFENPALRRASSP